ncbi:MAG: exodeoxyribonuclease VII small subunit [Candidatus Methylopumilus sp.]|jgi:exodeoxyribonuclease VII small subunit|nr:exodeoxyribonuclease VII small subunit [Candidatus Methylopumilus sp.]NBW60578.1 exodeoxyribonuclease VII small subunit [Methylophilaceae bacterium]
MSENSTNSNQADQGMGFETAMAELESIIRQMEGQQLPLQDALAAFKRGTALLQQCQQTLADAEQQVRILTEQQTLTPFQDK